MTLSYGTKDSKFHFRGPCDIRGRAQKRISRGHWTCAWSSKARSALNRCKCLSAISAAPRKSVT